VEELRTHRAELVQQLQHQGLDAAQACAEADQRLGSVEDFCAATLARPELRGWASRAPWLVFAVLPMIALVAWGIALVALLVAWMEWMDPAAKMAIDASSWRWIATALAGAVLWVLPLGLCGLLLAIAWRTRSAPTWPSVGLLLVAALAAAVNVGLTPPIAGGQGQLTMGIGYPPREMGRTLVLVVAAFAGVALVVLRWHRSRAAPRVSAG